MITSLILAGITILMPAESGVRGSTIDLGEIVTISGVDAATLAVLEDIELGSSPSPGYRRVIDLNDIAGRIRRVRPDLTVTFEGHRATSVFTETVLVDAQTILDAVDAHLGGLAKERDITWVPAKKIGALEVPRGEQGIGLPTFSVELADSELKSGNVDVAIRVKVGGGIYRTIFASWTVSVWEELPVLIRNVPTGQRVTPALFEYRRVATPSGKNTSVLTPANMVGAVAVRNLVVGSVVVDADVTRPKVVHIGDPILLVVRKGTISARVAATALETAGIGDSIRVKRSTNGLELVAVVISAKIVEVNLGE